MRRIVFFQEVMSEPKKVGIFIRAGSETILADKWSRFCYVKKISDGKYLITINKNIKTFLKIINDNHESNAIQSI